MRPQTAPGPARGSTGRSKLLLIGASLVVLTLAAYGRVSSLGFLNYDDPGYVTQNPHVLAGLAPSGILWALTSTAQANWHPLTWISLMLDATIGGADPRVYHTTNLLLHLANTLLLFLLLDRMTGAPGKSAFVAALFAVHPLHVESVAWIAERKDVLSTLFWLLTMAAYARYAARPSPGWYATVVASLALGLMSKPMLVTLPLVLLLLDYWPLERWPPKRRGSRVGPDGSRLLLLEKLPLLGLALVSSLVTLRAQGTAIQPLDVLPFQTRAANAAVSYVAYVVKMLCPRWLTVYYPLPLDGPPPWKVAGSVLVLAGLSVTVIRLARDRRWLAVGWFWYVVTLVPVIGLVQVGSQAMADRYTYVPLIGLFIVVAWGVPDLMGELALGGAARIVPAGLFAMLAVPCVAALAAMTWVQVGHWRSTVDLFTHALEVTTDNAVAHNDLADGLYVQGDIDRAVAHLREAVRIMPTFADAHFNLTHALLDQGKVDDVARLCREEEAAWPSDERTMIDRALLALQQRKYEEAAARLAETIRLFPDSATAHYNLAEILAAQGHQEEASVHYSELERIIGPEKARRLRHGGISTGESGGGR